MILTAALPKLASIPLIEQINIVALLTVTIVFFLVLLILGIMKSYKLKAENEKLSKSNLNSDEDNKVYQDFRDGHLYDNY